ncbi:N-formylglutamate amidohydrolase [Streptomyces sp. H10-C2]|uniref:N-formylglutamate amidohydrolase n=1 Tax=unclassified Streptomyces TaxID=2593676 RepID=UPI0024BB8D08|nr:MULTISPECIES: N-formylglutamate amidohydrolase [unclassified Streptomyces]MDJ0344303.1 N-formylglutamate amidohydrolase [Streptomyces sp. PH10-H1]MDJ0373672.1 N-formylglutamate amidohydrolase [Streptomyces sp. H10-C2]
MYAQKPGAARSAVVLHVPHSSRTLTPAARGSILLDDAALSRELDHMTDAHTDLIAARAAAAATVTPWTHRNLLSRLVIDPERFPDEREEMRAVGMGAVYTRTSHGGRLRPDDPDHERELLAAHFVPYAAAFTRLVDARLSATGRAVVIDVHSYPARALPYELHSAGARPAICLGTDDHHTPPWLLDAARRAFADCGEIGLNTPFAGCYVPLKHYDRNPDVSALMIEIRRDVYMTEPGGAPTDGLPAVARALTALIDAVSGPAARPAP